MRTKYHPFYPSQRLMTTPKADTFLLRCVLRSLSLSLFLSLRALLRNLCQRVLTTSKVDAPLRRCFVARFSLLSEARSSQNERHKNRAELKAGRVLASSFLVHCSLCPFPAPSRPVYGGREVKAPSKRRRREIASVSANFAITRRLLLAHLVVPRRSPL